MRHMKLVTVLLTLSRTSAVTHFNLSSGPEYYFWDKHWCCGSKRCSSACRAGRIVKLFEVRTE